MWSLSIMDSHFLQDIVALASSVLKSCISKTDDKIYCDLPTPGEINKEKAKKNTNDLSLRCIYIHHSMSLFHVVAIDRASCFQESLCLSNKFFKNLRRLMTVIWIFLYKCLNFFLLISRAEQKPVQFILNLWRKKSMVNNARIYLPHRFSLRVPNTTKSRERFNGIETKVEGLEKSNPPSSSMGICVPSFIISSSQKIRRTTYPHALPPSKLADRIL